LYFPFTKFHSFFIPIFTNPNLVKSRILASFSEAIGLIDLFDFDAKNKRAGIGIIIQNDVNRNNGFGKQALSLVINYAFEQLQLHQLYANIGTENKASESLFTTFGFKKIGIKKDWNFTNNAFHDEAVYQLIKK